MKKIYLLTVLLTLLTALACNQKKIIYNNETTYISGYQKKSEIVLNKGQTVFSDYSSVKLEFEIKDLKGLIDPDSVDLLINNKLIIFRGKTIGIQKIISKNYFLVTNEIISINPDYIFKYNVYSIKNNTYSVDIFFKNIDEMKYHYFWDLEIISKE